MITVTGNITGNYGTGNCGNITGTLVIRSKILYILANNNAQCIVNADYVVCFFQLFQCCRSVDFTPCSVEFYMVLVLSVDSKFVWILWTFLWIFRTIYGLTKSTNYSIDS